MGAGFIIGIDQSTQGTKALLFDHEGKRILREDTPHRQLVNEKGWVSHDPDEIRELFQHLERIRPSDFQTGQEYVNLNLLFWDGTYGYMEFKVRDQEAFQKFLSKKGEASF